MLINYKNLYIIGTSHIANKSLEEVEVFIEREKPEIVALELDKGRLHGLLSGEKGNKVSISKYGIKRYLFAKIGHYAEHKLGGKTGVKPGDEMKLAYELAQKNNSKIALIDQDIQITLKKLKITWKEKWNFFVDIVKGVYNYVLGKPPEISFDLRGVPSEMLIEKMISHVRDRYPNLYIVLIEERNQYMAKKLFALMRTYPEAKILAVVGAGHGKEMLWIIKTLDG